MAFIEEIYDEVFQSDISLIVVYQHLTDCEILFTSLKYEMDFLERNFENGGRDIADYRRHCGEEFVVRYRKPVTGDEDEEIYSH